MHNVRMIVWVLLLFNAFSMTVSADYTATRYPIVLVPGVMGWDSMFGSYDYFYGIKEAIEMDSDDIQVHLISLAAWMPTEQRGLYLKEAIEDLCAQRGYEKVNIIAHSHGATTARVAMTMIPDSIASLTTIAGPHYGTPFADYGASLPDWLVDIVTRGLNLTGQLTALLSHHMEWIQKQDAKGVLNDFTWQGMQAFNTRYPCAGVPPGGSFGQGSYGEDVSSPGAIAGDGRGNALNADDEGAILYYSFTGNIGHEAGTHPFDMADNIMMVTNLFNELYGYYGDADAFIPVASTHFGEVVCDTYPWNHLDEHNQFMGLIGADAPDPREVYRQQANRLKQAGL